MSTGGGRVGAVPVGGIDAADRLDVGVAVQGRDAGDGICVDRIACRARSVGGVDDDLPWDGGVGGDCGGHVVPGGCGW